MNDSISENFNNFIKYLKKVTPISVTDIGDSLWLWQVSDSDDGFEMLVTDFLIEKVINITDKHQHNVSVTNLISLSTTSQNC